MDKGEKTFEERYRLTLAGEYPVTAQPGFDFDLFCNQYERLIGCNLGAHTFPLEEDFSGKILLNCLMLPGDVWVDTASFTRSAKDAGYFFVGLKGISLGYQYANKDLFIPKSGIIVPHRLVQPDDGSRMYEKDVPILCYDGMIKYSSSSVHGLPPRSSPYGVLMGRHL